MYTSIYNQANQSVDVVDQSVGALERMWNAFVDYLPQLIGAALVLAIGWVIGTVLGRLTQRLLNYVGLDRWAERVNMPESLRFSGGDGTQDAGRAERTNTITSNFFGSVVKWLVTLIFLGVAADILNLAAVTAFLGAVLAYIPQAIVAVIMLAIGFIASQFVGNLVAGTLAAADAPIRNRTILASIVRWAIIVFAAMAALVQLGIVPQLIQIFFAGLVFALALAFGLGGRDHANDLLRRLREQT